MDFETKKDNRPESILPDPLELHQELEKMRGNINGIIQEFGGLESYQKDVEQYIDDLTREEVEGFAARIREMIREEPMMAAYQEFGIDPLAPDLTTHPYPHPVRFEKKMLYDEAGKEQLEDAGLAGYYRPKTDEIVVYIPDPENEAVLRKYLQNTVAPDDLKARLKTFLQFNHFGPLPGVILHESIHSAQRPHDLYAQARIMMERSERAFPFNELLEMQAFSAQMAPMRYFGLFQRAGMMVADPEVAAMERKHSREIFSRMQPEVYEQFLKQAAMHAGISIEDIRPIYDALMNEDDAPKEQSPDTSRTRYNFQTDRLIVALHIIDQFRALGFSEKEIGRFIGEQGDIWDENNAEYIALENIIREETVQRGLDEEDLELITMCYKTQQRIDYNRMLSKSFSLMSETIKRAE